MYFTPLLSTRRHFKIVKYRRNIIFKRSLRQKHISISHLSDADNEIALSVCYSLCFVTLYSKTAPSFYYEESTILFLYLQLRGYCVKYNDFSQRGIVGRNSFLVTIRTKRVSVTMSRNLTCYWQLSLFGNQTQAKQIGVFAIFIYKRNLGQSPVPVNFSCRLNACDSIFILPEFPKEKQNAMTHVI